MWASGGRVLPKGNSNYKPPSRNWICPTPIMGGGESVRLKPIEIVATSDMLFVLVFGRSYKHNSFFLKRRKGFVLVFSFTAFHPWYLGPSIHMQCTWQEEVVHLMVAVKKRERKRAGSQYHLQDTPPQSNFFLLCPIPYSPLPPHSTNGLVIKPLTLGFWRMFKIQSRPISGFYLEWLISSHWKVWRRTGMRYAF